MLCVVMVFSLAACGGSESGGEAAGENKLVIADGEWYGTDMFQNDSWESCQSLIADTLFAIDPETGALIDGVCTNLVISEDGKTMTFDVPEGRYYATGEQLEPEDIKASLEWGTEVSPYADGYENIESIDIDGRQVTFHLTNFRSDLLYYMGECFIGIIDKDQLDSMSKDELLWGAVPYGPYYVEEYEPGSFVTLKPNEGYTTDNPLVENHGKAYIDEIYVKFNTDDFTIIEELKSGDVDYWSSPSADGMEQLKDEESVIIADKSYPEVAFMELNTNDSVFEDLKVRQALCLLLDRDNYCGFTSGMANPAYAMIIPGMMYFSQDAEDEFKANYANDADKAQALLAEAGWEMGSDGYLYKGSEKFSFTMYASTDTTRQLICQAMQEHLKGYGMEMNIEAIDWNYVHEQLESDKYDAGIHSLSWLEPILIFDCCFDDPNAANNCDALYDGSNDCAATIDDAERITKIGKVQTEVLFPEWNMIPLYCGVSKIAYNSRIQNLNILGNGFFYVNDWKVQ